MRQQTFVCTYSPDDGLILSFYIDLTNCLIRASPGDFPKCYSAIVNQ